jgi:hypothetical protein
MVVRLHARQEPAMHGISWLRAALLFTVARMARSYKIAAFRYHRRFG